MSGDYFDYIRVDENRLGLAIADVSGKGVPASLIMAICRSVLRSQAPQNPSPAEVLKAVNRQLYPDIKEDMFISMAYLVVDHTLGSITLARAGHDARPGCVSQWHEELWFAVPRTAHECRLAAARGGQVFLHGSS